MISEKVKVETIDTTGGGGGGKFNGGLEEKEISFRQQRKFAGVGSLDFRRMSLYCFVSLVDRVQPKGRFCSLSFERKERGLGQLCPFRMRGGDKVFGLCLTLAIYCAVLLILLPSVKSKLTEFCRIGNWPLNSPLFPFFL